MIIYDINKLKQKAIDYLASLRKKGIEEVGTAATYITEFITELEKNATEDTKDKIVYRDKEKSL